MYYLDSTRVLTYSKKWDAEVVMNEPLNCITSIMRTTQRKMGIYAKSRKQINFNVPELALQFHVTLYHYSCILSK
jgi:hypothetical protein